MRSVKRLAMAMALDVPTGLARRFSDGATLKVKAGERLLFEGPASDLLPTAAGAPRLLEPVPVGEDRVRVTVSKPPDLPVPRGFSVVVFYAEGGVEQVSDYEIEPWSVW